MRQFFRHLKAAWLYSRYFPYIEEADDQDYWNENDAKALDYFFRTVAGQKLQNRLRNYAITSAWNAVKKPGNHQYENGLAAGIQMTIAAIDNHFPGGIPTDAESEQSEGQAALDRLETETA